MKRVIVALIACLFLSSFGAATQREWVAFSSPEGRFRIEFPKEPVQELKDVDYVVGKLTMYSASSSTVTYMAAFADYPSEPGADRQQTVFDGLRDSLATKLEARVFDETRISLNGNPGLAFRMSKTLENGQEIIYYWRAYLVGRRLYQVAASYYKRDSQPRELPKYFDSFQLAN